jgi:cytidylate kinase
MTILPPTDPATLQPPNYSRNPLAGYCICVDGPTASGKGTLAKALARHWRLKFLDTGTLYRAVAWQLLRQGGDPSNLVAARAVAEFLATPGVFDFRHLGNNEFAASVAGELIGAELRSLAVGQAASVVAVQPPVRAALLSLQQTFVRHWQPLVGVVLDGRDTGARIAPAAQVKLFLTASVAERGRRRWLEITSAGQTVALQDVTAQVAARDARDAENLIQTPDAVVLDGTQASAADILQQAIVAVQTKLGRAVPPAPHSSSE